VFCRIFYFHSTDEADCHECVTVSLHLLDLIQKLSLSDKWNLGVHSILTKTLGLAAKSHVIIEVQQIEPFCGVFSLQWGEMAEGEI
jgi:hypothetical protein